MNKCLAAFTPAVLSPPFINASLTDDGKVEVMVRSEPKPVEGKSFPIADFASMKMTRAEFETWAREALDTLGKV